ncbi:MAG: hypothetical protein J0L62_07760 [Bacteroidetes bacterium]|nr:hypothetical protein [Bacteroidota bacterium]
MSDELVLIEFHKLISTFKANFKKSVFFTGVISVLIAPLLFLMPNKYTSIATILPSTQGGGLSDLGAVAGLIGVSIPEFGSQGASDELIPDILFSERILDSLILKKWKYSEYDSLVSLYTVFEIEPTGSSLNPDREIKEILIESIRKGLLKVSIEKETGLITLSFTVPNDPRLAQEIVRKLLFHLDIYNRQFRKTKSTDEFIFLDKRLQEVYGDLVSAENRLATFEKVNKNWQMSPDLNSDWKRLNREVLVNTTLWTELRKQYEGVKINVEKEKQTIDVLDSPTLPSKKSGPKRLFILIGISVGLFLGFQIWFYFNLTLKGILNRFPSLVKAKNA